MKKVVFSFCAVLWCFSSIFGNEETKILENEKKLRIAAENKVKFLKDQNANLEKVMKQLKIFDTNSEHADVKKLVLEFLEAQKKNQDNILAEREASVELKEVKLGDREKDIAKREEVVKKLESIKAKFDADVEFRKILADPSHALSKKISDEKQDAVTKAVKDELKKVVSDPGHQVQAFFLEKKKDALTEQKNQLEAAFKLELNGVFDNTDHWLHKKFSTKQSVALQKQKSDLEKEKSSALEAQKKALEKNHGEILLAQKRVLEQGQNEALVKQKNELEQKAAQDKTIALNAQEKTLQISFNREKKEISDAHELTKLMLRQEKEICLQFVSALIEVVKEFCTLKRVHEKCKK